MPQFAIATAWHYGVHPKIHREDFISQIASESLCITQEDVEETEHLVDEV